MPSRFFITHSHKDNDFVARLADDLKSAGLDGFLDIYSLKAGDLISREISQGLSACDFYLPVLSNAALDSPWCELEIHTAITLSNEPGRNGRPRIIPLLVEDCQARLDPFLRARLYLKFHENYDAAFLNLLRGLGVGGAIGQVEPSHEKAPPATKPQLNPQPIRVIAPEQKIITPPAPEVELPSRIINKAGQEMILIPAGEFLMGSAGNDKSASKDEKPQHTVFIDAFYISRYPVANSEYKKFVDETEAKSPKHWNNGKIPNGKDNHPVVNLDWSEAVAYCEWVGGRLPTEAEWEKAASWDEANNKKRIYPWGDTFDYGKCNSSESGIGDTTPVGKYSPQGDSAYGVGDMAGNVWEWCADWYDEDYYKHSPGKNPGGAASGKYRVVRGGSFLNEGRAVRCASRFRYYPDFIPYDRGFRVVLSPANSGL